MIPIILVGLLLNGFILSNADEDFIFKNEIILLLALVFIAIFVWIIYKDKKVFKNTKSRLSFLPTITAIIFIVSFLITNIVLANRDNSPIIIQAGYDGGFNGAWFEFRKDGTYKFGNSGGIGITYSRGKYILKDSLITLDKDNIDNTIQSKLLIIRKEKIIDTLEQVIYQINQEHQIISKDLKFIIHVDKRKK
ncbi:MAG: hypothetical protein ABJB05_15925 [Parafilimonas sp.]